MKREGRRIRYYSSKTLLNAWRSMLEELNRIKANDFEGLDPEAVAGITDYVLDNIDHYRPVKALEVRP